MAGVEEWRAVVGYGGLYEVSNFGEVRSIRNATKSKSGELLRQRSDKRGRRSLTLYSSGVAKALRVHRLVAEAFIPNPEGYPLVRHWDDNASNNYVGNLLWGTQKDNMQDAVRNGLIWQLKKTHCPQNHEYTEENTYTRPGATIHRQCRTCINKRNEAAKTGPSELPEVDHGTTARYSRGCRCADCVGAMRTYWNKRDAMRAGRKR